MKLNKFDYHHSFFFHSRYLKRGGGEILYILGFILFYYYYFGGVSIFVVDYAYNLFIFGGKNTKMYHGEEVKVILE